MKRQPSWDKYEVALLIDAYIRITQNGETKIEVLQKLSEQLRNKAKNEGLMIDDTFRNLNGMMWQIGYVECAFKKTGYGKHMPSQLFQDMVNIYQNQRHEFDEIVETAHCKSIISTENDDQKENTISVTEQRIRFAKYLKQKEMKDSRIEYICKSFDEASRYAEKHRILNKDVWNVDNQFELKLFFERLHNDKIFKIVLKDAARDVFRYEKMYMEFTKDGILDCGQIEEGNDIEQRIVRIVADKYVYGYRLGSVIERLKLRRYLSEQGIDFAGSDEELESMIIKNGYQSNGKVMIESENKNAILNKEIDGVFDEGFSVIYYESFFETKSELMREARIATYEALKEYLKEKRGDLVFSKNYFSNNSKVTEDVAVAQEIMRIWGENVTASADELAQRLPFIPCEKVKFYLAQNRNFTWVSEGIYTRIDLISISEEEIDSIRKFTAMEIKRKGYVSLSELPLDSIIEENYEISEYAILFGTFEKCLKNEYSLHGRIITEVDAEFDALTLMKQFCDEVDELTLDEAISKVEEFTGVADRRIAYSALYNSMIRISEQNFVAQKRIHFDIDEVDHQIERFVKDGFIAIKEITSFALFPECGYTWNHYIVESFCYRFSKKYMFRTNLFNGKNAGAIVDKDVSWDYQEILTRAVARSGIQLEEAVIGKFLYDTGFMARSKFGGLCEIAERAQIIRED